MGCGCEEDGVVPKLNGLPKSNFGIGKGKDEGAGALEAVAIGAMSGILSVGLLDGARKEKEGKIERDGWKIKRVRRSGIGSSSTKVGGSEGERVDIV